MTEPSMQLLSSTFLEDAGSWLVPSTAVGAWQGILTFSLHFLT